ncbi:outer membrane protein assembly factor BamB family protein [Orenia marismortui]|uniref:outer membrane protein assembly factor BamB family protein n=1 Tax=Orenia marismortui TaxID=46469 RepID=UPI00037CF5F2|nr:PQQ-binding-like beta-propeller repeat protein [Orenia marismortui]
MKRLSFLFLIIVLILTLVACSDSGGENENSSLQTGVLCIKNPVEEATKNQVDNTTIEIKDENNKVVVEGVGEHTLTAGTYKVVVTASGYEDWVNNECNVVAGQTLTISPELIPEEIGAVEWEFTGSEGKLVSDVAVGSDGTIYFGDDNLYAVNPDGSEKWVYQTEAGTKYIYGPVIDNDNTVYFAARDKLYAINSDGSEKWILGTEVMSTNQTPAIGEDGTIYTTFNLDTNDNGIVDQGFLYAINPEDGSKKWSYELSNDSNLYTSSVTIGSDGAIYVTGFSLYVVNPDGIGKVLIDKSSGNYWYSPPAIGANNTLYVSMNDYDNNVTRLGAIDMEDQTLKWDIKVDEEYIIGIAIGEDGTIYTSGTNLSARNPDGSIKWTFSGRMDLFTPLTLGNDGLIYIGSGINIEDGYENSKIGIMYAINAEDGTEEWSFVAAGMSSPVIANDGTIYAGSDYLYALEGGNVNLADTPWPMYRNNIRRTNGAN